MTADGVTHILEPPFLVVATQNPIEYEGTYPLPEAQLDRFILRTAVGYPSVDDEWDLLARRMERGTDEVVLKAVTDPSGLRAMQAALECVHVDEAIGRYVVSLVTATRAASQLQVGASPRHARLDEAGPRARADARARLRHPGRREGDRGSCARAPRGAAQRLVGATRVSRRRPRRARRRGAGPVGRVSEPIDLRRQASPRLVALAAVSVAGLFGSILAGRPALVAIAAPFAVLLVAGIVLAERPDVRVAITPAFDRVVAGDDIDISVTITSSVPVSRVALWLPRRGFASVVNPDDGLLTWATTVGRRPASIPVRLHASRWGVEALGPARLELAGPLGLVRWAGTGGDTAVVRVLPDDGSLENLLPNLEPRTASGAHVSRRRGDGFEFAEIRQYREGDRLRSVNWYQSARRGELWVNERHPERSGDLVVLVDTFADRRPGGSASLELSVRVAWRIAIAHIAAHDRVGLVGFGGLPSWVLPGGGERARLIVIDRLLDSYAMWNEAQRSVTFLPRQVFPPGAQVVAVTGLHDERMTAGIAELVHRGHDTSVVVIAPREMEEGAGTACADRPGRARASVVEVAASRASPRTRTARHPCGHDDGRRPVAGAGVDSRATPTNSAVVMTRWATSVRWGAALGALVAGVLVVFVAASAAGADGRRGTVIFGIAGVAFLIAGLVISSGVYPAALVALAVSFSFSLTGHHVAAAGVIGTSALLLLVDQLTAWSFDAATGAIERGRDSAIRAARTVAVVVVGAGLTALVSRPATSRCPVASLPR